MPITSRSIMRATAVVALWTGVAAAPARDAAAASPGAAAVAPSSSSVPAAVAASSASAAEVDALGAPVRPEARAQYSELLAGYKGRELSEVEKAFILAVLDIPQEPSDVYKDRPSLVRHFLKAGVRLSVDEEAGFESTDLWRLVRATRAAAESFDIPSALLMCLTFRESNFDPRASAWTTSAKGVAQITNDTVLDIIHRIKASPALTAAAASYVAKLGARMPAGVEGARDVDKLTRELRSLQADGAPPEKVAAKRRERKKAILSHKDELGHIYNLETNFGLGAAYLAYLRRVRFKEVKGERKGWLTAVAAYNQGPGPLNELIHQHFRGSRAFNAAPVREAFSRASFDRLSVIPDFREEVYWYVRSVDKCSAK